MVLDESDQFFLVGLVGTEMESHFFCGTVFQTVVQPLVITVVKSLLLKLPLEVPVGLCDEQDARISLTRGLDDIRPIFSPWCLTCTRSPGSLEDWIRHEHG